MFTANDIQVPFLSNPLINVLSLQTDDWVTIIGSSGSGKSSLLKALAGLIPFTGSVTLAGIETDDIVKFRQQVAYVNQSTALFDETVADNLDFPYHIRQKTPDVARQKAGLMALGLTDLSLVQSIQSLSGGQKQRIGLLRYLLFPPRVLLLDEVTTGLDRDNKERVWAYIREQQMIHHFAIVQVTHDESEIAQAQRLIEIGVSHEYKR